MPSGMGCVALSIPIQASHHHSGGGVRAFLKIGQMYPPKLKNQHLQKLNVL